MSYPNIAVCSYNLNWEIMDFDSGSLKKYFSKDKLKLYKLNLISNIQNIYDYYNPQIYCFQEAAKYKDFINIFNPDIFSNYVNISGPEYMVTIWNLTRLQLIYVFPGEFESGRPFCIFLFKDLINFNFFILINMHAGHKKDTLSSIFQPIQQILDKSKKLNKYVISRIIMAGDFNRDINMQIKDNPKLYLKVNNFKFTFKPSNKDFNNTCCNLSGINLTKNYDFVLDSYEPVILRHELNKEIWYKQPSSDHIMIMSILKKYI